MIHSNSTATKCRVTCWVAGKVFTVGCYAANDAEAREVARAQHPDARILGVNAVIQ
jgi:hypothetical protein